MACTAMKRDYRVTFAEVGGAVFAEERYHGTLDYVLDCARAYCAKGELFRVYREDTGEFVHLETKGWEEEADIDAAIRHMCENCE